MHGLICKMLEEFVRVQHGGEIWERICRRAGVPDSRFEALRSYDDEMMERAFLVAFEELGRSHAVVLEDMGHWLCTHPPLERVRRLIRFSGTSFVDLVYSLDEINDRTRIALPGLRLPRFRVTEVVPNDFCIRSSWHLAGGSSVLTGILRAMADDYGALAVIEPGDRTHVDDVWHEILSVRIFDQSHQEPREFTLGEVS